MTLNLPSGKLYLNTPKPLAPVAEPLLPLVAETLLDSKPMYNIPRVMDNIIHPDNDTLLARQP